MASPANASGDGGSPPPTLGIVAALWIESLAMQSMIEDIEELPAVAQDPSHYYRGTLRSTDADHPHHVVMTTLPRDNTRNAAAICTDLIRSFESVRCVIMVGIAGGIPAPHDPARHVRLGDVVVATKGVVDYAHVIQRDGNSSPRRQVDDNMSHELARAANELAAKDFKRERPWDEWLKVRAQVDMRRFARPPENTDVLFMRGKRVEHPSRKASGHLRHKPKIHYGAIGSADMLLRDEVFRDRTAQDLRVLAIEMEGSGIAVGSATHGRQWFMVRGISDYCDNASKSDVWQPYASLAAAAYVRSLLAACHPFARSGMWRRPWRDRLINSLSRVTFWHLIANRRNLVTLLRTTLKRLPDLSDDDATAHLGRIVDLCVMHDPGLEALRRSLAAMLPAPGVADALAIVDCTTVGDLFPAAHLAHLRQLLEAETPAVDLSALWMRSRPDPLAEPSDLPANLAAAVEDLVARPNKIDNVLALLTFVSGVAQSARSQLIGDWLDGSTAQLGWVVEPLSSTGAERAFSRYRHTHNTNTDIPYKLGSIMTDVDKATSSLATKAVPSGGTPTEREQAPGAAGRLRRPEGSPRLGLPAVWNAPPRNLLFTGREELLTTLHGQLSRGDLAAVLPQALHGLGGVGKTQLAIEYVYRHQSDYDVVWWIPSEQPQQILSGLAELAQQLGLKVGPEANTAVPAVKEALRKGEPYANWLLVFDNAEDAASVQQNIPTGGSGKVLVTSRNAEWTLKAQSLEVDVFDRSESINLLRRRDKQISNENASRLAEALGDLPLAIEQAAAWRAATGMAVEEYLTLLAAKRPELLGITATSGYESSVAAVWTVSLERLGQINPAALQLLEVSAYFAPEPISRSFFTSSRSAITPQLDEALRDPIKLGRALSDVQKFALARVDHRTDTVQLHRLVQAVLIARIPEDRQEIFRHGAHELLEGANPRNAQDARNWERYAALVSHVVVSEAVRCQEPWVRKLVFDVVRYLYYWGDHQGCQDLAQGVFDTWKDLLGSDHPETLRMGKFLGYILWVNGEYVRAKEIHEDALARYEHTVAAEDEDLLDAKLMVAIDTRTAGQFDDSLALNENIFADCKRVFGEDDLLTLRAASDLGVVLRLCGRYREALILDTETTKIQSRVLGENNSETLGTTNGLTIDRRESGDYKGARDQQEMLYMAYVARFGDTNPATVRAGRNLAVARRRAGEHESALTLSREVERLFSNRYGRQSADAMAAALNLAADLRQNLDLPGSADRGTQVLEEYRRAMGETHPLTWAARTNLAVTLRLMGKIEDALEHDLEAWNGLREGVGPDHAWTLVAAINLASDKYALDEAQAAFELDSETLERARSGLGGDHPTTLACNVNLSLDLRALGRVAEANAVHSDVIHRFQQTLGKEHPATVAAVHHVRADCDIDPLPL